MMVSLLRSQKTERRVLQAENGVSGREVLGYHGNEMLRQRGADLRLAGRARVDRARHLGLPVVVEVNCLR